MKQTICKKKMQVLNEIEQAYNKLALIREQNQRIDREFRLQFDKVNEGLMSNYLKGNIFLLEFTDLFDSYNQSIILINQIRINLINANEELNFAVGI
jgi:outer membrane protein, heavy metal efflux system